MQKGIASEGIIRPAKGKKDPQIGTVALMVMLPEALKRLVQKAGAIEVPFSDTPLYRLYLMEAGTGLPTALAGPFFGAPHAVMGLEKLVALGAREVWILGWCGALQTDLYIGDLVVPVRAISEEGTSKHYPITGDIAATDPLLKRRLEDAIARSESEFKAGNIWTTDAIYRETPEKVMRFQKLGILAVDMEMSALLTVAAYRSVALAALLVVSDELSGLKWKPGFSRPRLKENTRLAGDLLLDLSMTLTGRDLSTLSGVLTGQKS